MNIQGLDFGLLQERCPSLGEFIPLVAADKTRNWQDICKEILSEIFDRNVLWICKHDPSMAAKFQTFSGGWSGLHISGWDVC